MGDQTDRLLAVLRRLNARLCRCKTPLRLLNTPPTWSRAGSSGWPKAPGRGQVVCIDIGHVGNRRASAGSRAAIPA
jgi:hypothetical protein